MTELKRPIGIASLLAEIGRNPDVRWATIRRFDKWQWASREVNRGGIEAVAHETEAILLVAGTGISGEVEVAGLTIAQDPAATGGAVVTAIELRVQEEYRHVAIVVGALGGEGAS